MLNAVMCKGLSQPLRRPDGVAGNFYLLLWVFFVVEYAHTKDGFMFVWAAFRVFEAMWGELSCMSACVDAKRQPRVSPYIPSSRFIATCRWQSVLAPLPPDLGGSPPMSSSSPSSAPPLFFSLRNIGGRWTLPTVGWPTKTGGRR
jgi:hypothetical protein